MVRPGQAVRASHFNAVRDAAVRLTGLRVGKGLNIRRGPQGAIVWLDDLGLTLLPGIIDRVIGTAGDNGPVNLSGVTYDVRIYARVELPLLTGVTPHYGRPSLDVDGYPAKVGDDCLVFRRQFPNEPGEFRVMVLSEATRYDECPPAAASMAQAVGELVGGRSAARGMAASDNQPEVADGA